MNAWTAFKDYIQLAGKYDCKGTNFSLIAKVLEKHFCYYQYRLRKKICIWEVQSIYPQSKLLSLALGFFDVRVTIYTCW